MFRKSIDTVIIAFIFVGVAFLLQKFNFWQALGLPTPTAFLYSGLMFLALVVIMQHTVFEPFMAISNERFEQTIEKRKRADERKNHAENILKSYEASILNARMDALKQRERIAIEAENEEKKMLDAAKQKSQANLDTALAEISTRMEETRSELSKSTDSLVTQLVEEILSPSSKKPGTPGSKSVESRI